MKGKLYIDQSCRICLKYASYIKSEESCKIAIQDIKSLDEDSYLRDEMVFESNNEYFYGFDAIIKSMEVEKESSIITKLLKAIPTHLGKSIYKSVAKNRKKISKLFNIIKPKS
jgi:predicted DCC family thiol-disulfide oxidoreductase YuxK